MDKQEYLPLSLYYLTGNNLYRQLVQGRPYESQFLDASDILDSRFQKSNIENIIRREIFNA